MQESYQHGLTRRKQSDEHPIEVKIQNFLKKLKIEFFNHQYINIKHTHQCDIFIPKQIRILDDGNILEIKKNTILECLGCYWHGCEICMKELSNKQNKQRHKDCKRRKELIGAGYNVIYLWEHEIKPMQLNQFSKRLI